MSLQPPESKCPFCQSAQSPRFILDKVNQNGRFSLYHCPCCGGEYFTPFKHPGEQWYEEVDSYNIKENFQPREIHSYHKKFLELHPDLAGMAVLELGCGTGEFLAELQKRGADTYGVDIDKTAIEIAQRSFGLPHLYAMSIEDFCSQPPRQDFDYVVMFEVFEHVYNPVAILQSAYQLLRDGGKLAMSTPSRERIFANWANWDYPYHHLSRWDGSAIKNILELNGWRNIHITYINRYHQLRELFLDILAAKLHFRSARKFKVDNNQGNSSSTSKTQSNIGATIKRYLIKTIYSLVRFIGVVLLPNLLALIFYPILIVFYPRSGIMYLEAEK